MKTHSLPLNSGRKKQVGKKVLIALSGGIDSAVSAYLLIKKGYRVEAAFMKNWSSQEGLLKNECPWLSDRRDALRVAGFLGIKMHTLDFEKQYQNTVMKYFFDEYKKGRTPNPDVMCNKEIKFKLLYNWALNHGFDFLATGHYAQIGLSAKRIGLSKETLALSPARYTLLRSKDEFKDQTYFIYNIKTEQLPRLIFPIGGMKKSAVKTLAKKIGLPNAEKKESMGLCFVGKIRLKDFLGQKIKPKKGQIVLSLREGVHPTPKQSKQKDRLLRVARNDTRAVVVGHHAGLHNYTLGQRQGIKVGAGGPYFVCGKDLKHNRLYVTNDPHDPLLLTHEVQIHSVNWINPIGLSAKRIGLSKETLALSPARYTLSGRYRHQGELAPLTISRIGRDHYRVIFKHPQKAIASGQSLVLYQGKECVGGGVIV